MANHDKLTLAAEYCRCIRVSYRIKGEALFIGGKQVCFSLYNIPFIEIVPMIDRHCAENNVFRFNY